MRAPEVRGAGADPPARPAGAAEARGTRTAFRAHLRAAVHHRSGGRGGGPAGVASAATGPAGGVAGIEGAGALALGPPDGEVRRAPRPAPVVPAGAGPLAAPGLAPGPGPTGAAPTDAAAHAEAARAAVTWIARCAVAAAAAPGVLRLHLDDRRLGRVGLQVRVRGRRVTVHLAAGADARRALLAEERALAAALSARGLVLDTCRVG